MELVTEGRKLVTIRKIDALDPIDGADMIEVATVDGWQVVVKKGEFQKNQYCVFFEIDSFLPITKDFEFLLKGGTKLDEHGVERIRLKTIRLRGQLSQGLALPISAAWDALMSIVFQRNDDPMSIDSEIDELLEELEDSRSGIEQYLNVTKYERPSERNGNGTRNAKTGGDFPITIPKTDEDRIQNVYGKYTQTMRGVEFRQSLKMEGSSHTIACFTNPEYFMTKLNDDVKSFNEETGEVEVVQSVPYPFNYEQGQVIVASRNQTLKYDANSHFWVPVVESDLPRRLYDYCIENDRQLAIQSEVMGPGIQGNIEKLENYQLFAFRVWDIDKRRLFNDAEFQQIAVDLDLQLAPQGPIIKFFDEYENIKDALASAEHKSINAPNAEGDVYKSVDLVDGKIVSFKVINNKYLLKEKD